MIKTPQKIKGEELPKGYKAIERLYQGHMIKEYMVICHTQDDSITAIVYYDGISETPVRIEKYLSNLKTDLR